MPEMWRRWSSAQSLKAQMLEDGDFRSTMGLSDSMALGCGSAADLRLDVVERADPVQRRAGDVRLGALPDVVKVTAQMRPAGGFAELRGTSRIRLIQVSEPATGVRRANDPPDRLLTLLTLQDALALLEVLAGVFTLAIGREVIGHARGCCPRPGALVADVGPYPTLLDALAKLPLCLAAVEHADWGVIRCPAMVCLQTMRGGMQQVTGHHIGPQEFDQRRQGLHGTAAPAVQEAVRNIGAHPGEDLGQAVEGKVIVVFGNHDEGQEARSGEAARNRVARNRAARNRAARRRALDHPFAAAAGLLQPRHLDHLHPGSDHVEDLAYVLTHQTQGTAAVQTRVARIHLAPLTRGVG